MVYGAGSIGGAVAAAFAKAGATVFVAAHHEDTLKKLADKNIQTERLDVLDKDAVAAFVKAVVEKTGAVWDESSKKAHWKNRKPGQPFFAVFIDPERRLAVPDLYREA